MPLNSERLCHRPVAGEHPLALTVVEDAFHGLPLAAERGVSVEIASLQAQGILGRFAAERNVEDGRLYLRTS